MKLSCVTLCFRRRNDMHKFRTFFAKAGASALAVSMIFQSTAFASPIEELTAVIEAQNEAYTQHTSLLEEFLGTGLGAAMKENGFSVQVKGNLMGDTIRLMDAEEILSEDSHISFGFRNDPKQRKWLLEAGGGQTKEPLLNMSLYGDENRLAFSLPQFYKGALSLHAGNLAEQYEGSVIAQIMSVEGEEMEMPNINMSFYPSEGAEVLTGAFGGWKDEILTNVQELGSKAAVEKTEEGDTSVYTVTVDTEHLVEFYQAYMSSYLSLLSDFGVTGLPEMETFESEMEAAWDEMLASMEQTFGESFSVDVLVKDDLVSGYRFETTMPIGGDEYDTAYVVSDTLEAAESAEDAVDEAAEITEDAADEAEEITEDAADEAEEVAEDAADEAAEIAEDMAEEVEEAHVVFDFTFADPTDITRGYTCKCTVTSDYDTADILFDMASETDGTVEKYTGTYDISVEDAGTETLMSMPFEVTFNSETGDLDGNIEINADGETFLMKLDSTFGQVEKDKGFVWTVDELSMSYMGESLGIKGEVAVSADPGEFEAPQEERVLLDLTQGELIDLMNEIMANANTWMAQFMPEDAAEDSLDDAYTEDAGMEEMLTETEALGGSL